MKYQKFRRKQLKILTWWARPEISSIKQGTHGVEVKFNDKLKALELLGKHLGLFHKGKNEFKKVEDNGLISAIKEASGEAWEHEILDV